MRFFAPLSVFIFGISALLYRYFGRNTRRDFLWFFDFRLSADFGFAFFSGPRTMIMLRPSSFAADSTLATSSNFSMIRPGSSFRVRGEPTLVRET